MARRGPNSGYIRRRALWLASVFLQGVFTGGLAIAKTADEQSTNPAPLAVAVVGPLTPSSKAFGIPHLQSTTLAIDKYNRRHTTDGKQIQLKLFDDRADPATSISIVKSLSTSNVVAILGPANSAVAQGVVSLLQDDNLRLPVISSLATATNLTEGLRTKYFFRANVSDRNRLSACLD
jgi:ABC-type branched-subunit amino acid transport system substrate-binding protein